ncbi:MAG: c-type cytochrome [Bryobacteraceae bacterium]
MTKKFLAALGACALTGTMAIAAEKGDAAAGKEVFAQCSVCHNADSTTAKVGPGLKGLYKKAKLINGKKVTDAAVMTIINEGAGDGKMPPYADMLSEKERADVLAYLKTI